MFLEERHKEILRLLEEKGSIRTSEIQRKFSVGYDTAKRDLRLLEEQKLDVANCLMIGNDRNTDIAGAMAAGMATLYMHTNLTPPDQAEADPELHPLAVPGSCRDYEYEGYDWEELAQLIVNL